MKLSALSFANAAGVTAAILWTVCALVAIILPDLYQAGANLLAVKAHDRSRVVGRV